MTNKPTAAAMEDAREWLEEHLPRNSDTYPYLSLAAAFDAFAAQPSADGLADEWRELAGRIKSRMVVAESGCWEWPGSKVRGYGQVGYKGKTYLTHRIMVFDSGREIPEGMQPDHLCRNRACCNPDHLEVVTRLENVRRGEVGMHRRKQALSMTHCLRGHPMDGQNIYTCKRGRRTCLTCRNITRKIRRAGKPTGSEP